MASPLDQFQIKPIVSLGKIGNSEIAFTNSSLFMMLVVLAIGVFFMMATAQRNRVTCTTPMAMQMGTLAMRTMVRRMVGT